MQLNPASLFRESPGEVTAHQTPLCTCFLGEQPNLLGNLKARTPLVQAVGQIQLLSIPLLSSQLLPSLIPHISGSG